MPKVIMTFEDTPGGILMEMAFDPPLTPRALMGDESAVSEAQSAAMAASNRVTDTHADTIAPAASLDGAGLSKTSRTVTRRPEYGDIVPTPTQEAS